MPQDLTKNDISDIESNEGDDIPASGRREDEEAEDQVNGELNDEVEETQNRSGDGDGDEDEDENEKEDGNEDENEDENEEENENANGEDEDDDDEAPEDEYEVEAIRAHKIVTKGPNKGYLLYIKWKGFPEDENTWEPEANLNEDSKKLMETYFKSVGGRPDPETKTGPRKRKSAFSIPDQPTSAKKSKRNGSSENASTWTPASKNWEPEIERVDTVDRDPSTKKLNAYIIFKNGKRIKVGMEMVYKHCPKAMLKFYEEHLKFK